MQKDQISLKDIDPSNIPAFMDVIIDPREKEVVMMGRWINDDESIEGGRASGNGANQSTIEPFKHKITGKIFEEKSFQEFQDEHSFFFDASFKVTSWRDRLGRFIRWIPVSLFLITYFLTDYEYREAMLYQGLLEDQELKHIDYIRSSCIRSFKQSHTKKIDLPDMQY